LPCPWREANGLDSPGRLWDKARSTPLEMALAGLSRGQQNLVLGPAGPRSSEICWASWVIATG